MRASRLKGLLAAACAFPLVATGAWAQGGAPARKPNVVIIMSDDVGPFNISAYNLGMMGYKTPNLDRIAREGALFTDWYGEQSCTAGRAALITGQSPIRSGLLKVGLPGAPLGMNQEDPTLATMLKDQGYATGQFGKNHLGDRNEHLPTVNGFDEFFGFLYALSGMEEPERPDYPKDPAFQARYGPRNMIHSHAVNSDDTTIGDPRFGKVGKQRIEDAGPLTKKRMETVDDEITAMSLRWMERQVRDQKPFLLYLNPSRMHAVTHLRKEFEGKTGYGLFADGMYEHDGQVGQVLDKLDQLGISDNTVVIYTSDNGPHVNAWPDGGATIFRGEKNTQWEGGYRVPALIRWPGTIKPGTVINEIASHQDVLPTIMAALGDTSVKEDLVKGRRIGNRTYRVHLDGYNLLPLLKGETTRSPRQEFLYWTDSGDVAALRYGDMKITYLRQNSKGMKVWETAMEELRLPIMANLRSDPFERASDEAFSYTDWSASKTYLYAPAAEYVTKWLMSFRQFPPRAKPGTFGIEDVMEKMLQPAEGGQ